MVIAAKCATGQIVSSAKPSFTKNLKESEMSKSINHSSGQGSRATLIARSQSVIKGTRSTSNRMGHARMKMKMRKRRIITMHMHLSNRVQKETRIVSDPGRDIRMSIRMLTVGHVRHNFAQGARVLPEPGIVIVARWAVMDVRPSSAEPRTQ